MKKHLMQSGLGGGVASIIVLSILSVQGWAEYRPLDLPIPPDANPEMVKDAGNQAIQDLMVELLGKQGLPKRFAALPLERDVDGGYFTMQLRNTFTACAGQGGHELYTRMDAEWQRLLDEIKWGQSFGDTMDVATVQKFGRIQGVQGLLMGRVSGISVQEGDVRVRVIVQAFEVETGRLLWGQEKVGSVNPAKKSVTKEDGVGFRLPKDFLRDPFWIAVIGGSIVGLLLLLWIFRSIAKAARPR